MFHDPQIRRLSLVRWIALAGSEASFFVGVWGRAAFELGATPGRLALLMATMAVAGILGSAAGGVLVDRLGPRRVLLSGQLLVIPSTLALMLPQTMTQLTWAVVAPSAAAMAAYSAIATFPALLARKPDELARANAALELGSTAAFVTGPALGAVLVSVAGVDTVFLADAVSSLVAVAIGRRLPAGGRGGPLGGGSPLVGELTAGLRYAYQRPRVRFALGLGMVSWLAFGTFGALEPLYFRDILHAGPAALGWVNAVFGVGLAGGSLLLDRNPRRFTTTPAVTSLVVAAGMGAVLYTVTDQLRIVVAAALVWGAVLGVLMPGLRTLVQRETPPDLVGRMMGVVQLHERTGDLVPLAIAPALATAFGVQQILVGSGVLISVLAAALTPVAIRLDGSERRETAGRAAPTGRRRERQPSAPTVSAGGTPDDGPASAVCT